MAIENVNKIHQESFTKKEKVIIWITDQVSTVECAIVFAGIGVGSLVGVVTGNAILALLCGAFSSYFLQLVMLPLITIRQKLDQRHAELVAENDYEVNKKAEREIEYLHDKIDALRFEISLLAKRKP